jgi:hypothetical protein
MTILKETESGFRGQALFSSKVVIEAVESTGRKEFPASVAITRLRHGDDDNPSCGPKLMRIEASNLAASPVRQEKEAVRWQKSACFGISDMTQLHH